MRRINKAAKVPKGILIINHVQVNKKIIGLMVRLDDFDVFL